MSDSETSVLREEGGVSYEGAKLTCGVLYTCYGAIGEVEDWLDDNCEGDFHLVIEGMDDDLVKKSLKIMFEMQTDKARFVDLYAKK